MDLSSEELEYLQGLDIMELKREELVFAEDIVIDPTQDVKSRRKAFAEQSGNPFAQKMGEYIVQIGFAEGIKDTIEDRMVLLARRKINLWESVGEE